MGAKTRIQQLFPVMLMSLVMATWLLSWTIQAEGIDPLTKTEHFNFVREFCPNVEVKCKSQLTDTCLSSFLDPVKLRKDLQNKTIVYMTGFGGDIIDRNDYFDKTSIPMAEKYGAKTIKLMTDTVSNSTADANKFCDWARNKIRILKAEDKRNPLSEPRQLIFFGHSKAGRVLYKMAYQSCPEVMDARVVHSIFGTQAAIGPSPLANWKEQFDSVRWQEAKKVGIKSEFDPQVFSKVGAFFGSELGRSVEKELAFDKRAVKCESCRNKMLFLTSTWKPECDPKRVFKNDTSSFIEVRDRDNDLRLPLKSQTADSGSRVIAQLSCVAHSDLYKARMMPEHLICQQAMNLWILQKIHTTLESTSTVPVRDINFIKYVPNSAK